MSTIKEFSSLNRGPNDDNKTTKGHTYLPDGMFDKQASNDLRERKQLPLMKEKKFEENKTIHSSEEKNWRYMNPLAIFKGILNCRPQKNSCNVSNI